MKLDKQTENNAQLFFRNVIEETGFIDKLRSVTQVIKGRLSQHDTRNAEKIVYPYEYLFTVILLAGMAGFKTKDEVRLFWRTNSDFFSKVFPDLFGYIPSTSTITRAQRIIEHSVMGDVIKDIMSRHYNLVRMCRKIYATEVLSMRDVLACDGQAMRATDRLQPDGEFVISKQADVFASLKSNQGRTFEEIEYAYGLYQKGEPSYRKPGHYATATGTVLSGGYFYNRSIVTLRAEDCMTQDVLQKWPHIRTVAIIETDRANMVTNEVTHSIRYYITTLEMDSDKYPDFARDLLDISLKRWCVEVNHWHIDRFFGQDQAAYENDDAAFCSTIVSKLTMSMFNFAKRSYSAEERRYKGACTTPILQRACEDIRFSALLLESFFAHRPEIHEKRRGGSWILAGSGNLRSRAMAASAVYRAA